MCVCMCVCVSICLSVCLSVSVCYCDLSSLMSGSTVRRESSLCKPQTETAGLPSVPIFKPCPGRPDQHINVPIFEKV